MSVGPRPKAFITDPPRKVVFLCVKNSARSQMAEGYARAMAPPGTEIWSAGLQGTRVHPLAVQVMQEAGLDITAQTSKALGQVPWRQADTLVTLCGEAEEACPRVGADVRRVHWPLPDPARAADGDALQAFREIRDEVRWRVSSLWPRGG